MPRPTRTRKLLVNKPVVRRKPRALACVLLGDGIGNIVQQTPLLIAACQWYEQVDVYLARSSAQHCQLFTNIPLGNIRRVYHAEQLGEVAKHKYDAAFATWLVRHHRKYVTAKIGYVAAHPKQRPESQAALQAIEQAGWKGDCPAPICGWAEPKISLPAGPLIGISTGSLLAARWMAKRYPAEHYLAVIDLVLAYKLDATFVHVGIETDTPLPHSRVLDLRSKLGISESAGVLRKCQGYVGNDTGMSHVAAALGVPSVVLFGPTVVSKNVPPRNAKAVSLGLDCQPCQLKKWFRRPGIPGPCSIECMKDLPPATVATAVLESLRA